MQRPEVFHRDHCFEYPKKPLIKSSHPKKYLPNFPTPQNPGIEIFSSPPPPSKYFDHPRHSKSVVPLGFEQAWSHTINDGSTLDPIGRSPFLLLSNLPKVARTVFCFYIAL